MASRTPLWIAGGVVAGVVAVVIVVVIIVVASIDSIVKAAVENVGPQMTQSKVTLDEVEISTTSGEGRLAGLVVGNPQGFTTPSAMRLGEVAVKIDVSTIAGDTIVIEDLLIRAPELTYELGGPGSNLDAIRKNIDSYVGRSAAAADKSADADAGGKKLVIENLRVQDGRISVAATALAGRQLSAGLPDIHLKDVGKDKGGATPAEVAERLIAAIQQNVARAVQPLGLDKLEGVARGALGSATEGLSGGGAAASGAVKEAGDTLKKLLAQ